MWKTHKPPVLIPFLLPNSLSQDYLETLELRIRLDELTKQTSTRDYNPEDIEFMLSEEDPDPKTIKNTSIERARELLLKEQQELILKATKKHPWFTVPSRWEFPSEIPLFTSQLMIPQDENTEKIINAILGPENSTIDKILSTTGARVQFKGKGFEDEIELENSETTQEPPNIIITGTSVTSVQQTQIKIQTVIDQTKNSHLILQIQQQKQLLNQDQFQNGLINSQIENQQNSLKVIIPKQAQNLDKIQNNIDNNSLSNMGMIISQNQNTQENVLDQQKLISNTQIQVEEEKPVKQTTIQDLFERQNKLKKEQEEQEEQLLPNNESEEKIVEEMN
ncbi:splicing factor 1 [Anaeramoeba flamelloides]|uniref:Splicing factor 1 n=1 Tax=Anaeramoeba flamelloides TaxID=1746091 RepID=A0ABQ8XIW8_9EUKA|nr:splicing factor 1 [Anaeramoeba flamelloides]